MNILLDHFKTLNAGGQNENNVNLENQHEIDRLNNELNVPIVVEEIEKAGNNLKKQ